MIKARQFRKQISIFMFFTSTVISLNKTTNFIKQFIFVYTNVVMRHTPKSSKNTVSFKHEVKNSGYYVDKKCTQLLIRRKLPFKSLILQ